jgi:hypothetical protein
MEGFITPELGGQESSTYGGGEEKHKYGEDLDA